jgi:hypothetical protein
MRPRVVTTCVDERCDVIYCKRWPMSVTREHDVNI